MLEQHSAQADHAERAVEAAVEMQAVMQALKAKWQRKLGVAINLGIGINELVDLMRCLECPPVFFDGAGGC